MIYSDEIVSFLKEFSNNLRDYPSLFLGNMRTEKHLKNFHGSITMIPISFQEVSFVAAIGIGTGDARVFKIEVFLGDEPGEHYYGSNRTFPMKGDKKSVLSFENTGHEGDVIETRIPLNHPEFLKVDYYVSLIKDAFQSAYTYAEKLVAA